METHTLDAIPATGKIHRYRTEKTVTLKCDVSFLVGLIVAGTFFVLGCWYLG
jgi:hypothetical protein